MTERFPSHAPDEQPRETAASAAETEASYEPEPRPNPRIYVTRGLPMRVELTDGTWLDMAREPADIHDELYIAFGTDEDAEGKPLYIWDYQGFGNFEVATGAIGLEGVDSIDLLAQVARGIAEHGPAYAAYANAHEDDPRLFNHFASSYKGHHATMGTYVQQLFEPLKIEELLRTAAPEGLQDYVRLDYDGIGEEMVREGDIVAFPADGGGVWIFDERA